MEGPSFGKPTLNATQIIWVAEWILDECSTTDTIMDTLFQTVSPAGLPPTSKVRLLLRVLDKYATGGSEADKVDAQVINLIEGVCSLLPQLGDIGRKLEPSPDLMLQVRTFSALRAFPLYDSVSTWPDKYEEYKEWKEVKEKYVEVLEQMLPDNPNNGNKRRRQSIIRALEGAEMMKREMRMVSLNAVNDSLRTFVNRSVAALGPSFLHRVQLDVRAGKYPPKTETTAAPPAPQDANVEITTNVEDDEPSITLAAEKTEIPEVKALKESRAALDAAGTSSHDPLVDSLRAAETAKAAKGKGRSLMDSQPDARTHGWESPGSQKEGSPIAVGDGIKLPIGAPIPEFGELDPAKISVKVKGGKSPKKKGRPRGRHGNPWTEVETNKLVEMVKIVKEGKWKKMKELAGGVLDARTPVDLKDKWRNLVKTRKVDDNGDLV